eukprot:jgi/Botrbrau1/9239/Bobra.180_1s0001.1
MEFNPDSVSTILTFVGSTLILILGLFSYLFSSSDDKDSQATRPSSSASRFGLVAAASLICISHLAWTGICGAVRAATIVIASELIGAIAWGTILALALAGLTRRNASIWLRTALWPAPLIYTAVLVAAIVSVRGHGALFVAFLATRGLLLLSSIACVAAFEASQRQSASEAGGTSEPLLQSTRPDVEAGRGLPTPDDVPKP